MVVERAELAPAMKFSHWRRRWIQLVASSSDAFLEVDGSGTVIEWNPRAEELFGWGRDEVVGRPVSETLLPSGLSASPFSPATAAGGNGAVRPAPRPGAEGRQRFELVDRAGHTLCAEGELFASGFGSGRRVGGFIRPPVEQGLIEARPARADLHDALTGLPNRALFSNYLARCVATGTAPGSVAVVLLDLDRFKAINNTMGHEAGDRLLVAVAERLRRVAGDAEIIARFGGDEFLALFHRAGGDAEAMASAFVERARASLAEPFDVVGGGEVFLDESFGVALNTFGVDDPAELLSNAEAAMYQAKYRGGSMAETFGESMRIDVLDRMTTEHSLHRALERSELMLHYQPVVEIEGVATVGLEALVRWQHPDQGLVAPYRFIPVAEESGLIIPIGAWVLEQACHQLADWHRGKEGPKGSIEVNLSARQIDDPLIVSTVEAILSRTGLPPEHLTLEITESALMRDASSALGVLRALKEVGVVLAIDDFGTGYSSLSYLQRFPLDILKVDRSFVEELGLNGESDKIVSAVISLAHALGLKVVAEGVETTQQLEVLRSFHCDFAQGFLFSAPLPAADIVASFGLPISA